MQLRRADEYGKIHTANVRVLYDSPGVTTASSHRMRALVHGRVRLATASAAAQTAELLNLKRRSSRRLADKISVLPMLMESSRCLEDEIVESPVEVDMALIFGLGFPPFRGGIFRWADEEGLERLAAISGKHVKAVRDL